MKIRVGQGFDVHAFGEGDHVFLGGVKIEFDRGLEAHSDGDVALHALCDALLGAAGLGNIGQHFPPADAQWQGASGLDLLARVRSILEQHGFSVGNCDVTVICEKPRIAPHAQAMREHISSVLRVSMDCVSLKATTTERMGYVGREEGIAAHAVALLVETHRD